MARRLVSDPHRADDAVQDTVLHSLGKRPRNPGSFRAWLGSILRNTVRQERRERGRRIARESLQTPGEPTPSTYEVVEQLTVHRELVKHVQGLDEPYRTTIALRFLHGLSVREIARDLEVPRKTVHTRIERGIAKLRDRLDRDFDGRRGVWVALLTPLSNQARSVAGMTISSLVVPMNSKILTVSIGALFVGALAWLPFSNDERPSSKPNAEIDSSGPRIAAPSNSDPAATRVNVDVRERAEAPLPSSTDRVQVRGEVRQLSGSAVGNLRIEFERRDGGVFVADADTPNAISASDGSFAMAVPPVPGRLVVVDDEFASVTRPRLTGSLPQEPPLVVVARSRDYCGRVVDEHGQPIARADVELSIDGSWLQSMSLGTPGFDIRAVHLLLPFSETRTDDLGRFRFEGVGVVAGTHVEAHRDGFARARLELPGHSTDDLELVLDRERPTGRVIYGVVLEPGGGVGVADAHVSLGFRSVTTGPDGSFSLELESWLTGGTLIALRVGRLPGVHQFTWTGHGDGSRPDRPIVMTLGGNPLSISGRVLDLAGDPVAGAIVWSPQTTTFGDMVYERSGKSVSGEMTVEQILSGARGSDPSSRCVRATTDANGAFELIGLQRRDYAVMALVPETLASVPPVSIPAGSDAVDLVLVDEPRRRVAGRVVSNDGAPIEQVKVAVGRSLEWRPPQTKRRGMLPPPGASLLLFEERFTHTDADGRFEFSSLCTDRTSLFVSGQAIVLGKSFQLADAPHPEKCEIAVDVACRFRVKLRGDPNEADAFAICTADKPAPTLFVEVESHTVSTAQVDIVDGRSGVALITAGDHSIWLLKNGERVRRVPVTFSPGGVHEIGV